MRTAWVFAFCAVITAVVVAGVCLAMAQVSQTPAPQTGEREQAAPPTAVERWGGLPPQTDPWAEMQELQERIDRIMADIYGSAWGRPPAPPALRPPGFYPETDVRETDSAIVVACDLPGMEKEKIDITYKDGNLIISGSRDVVEEKEGTGWYVHERSSGSFERVIPIGVEIKENEIKADYKNGVLTITLPKVESATKPGVKVKVI
jgi:HSP20 family protein